MAVVRGDSPSNPLSPLAWERTLRRGRRLTRLALGSAATIAVLCAASVVAYLGRGGGYFVAFVVTTLLLFLATFMLLARMRASGVQLRLVRGVPVTAAVTGADFKRYLRFATPAVKAWSACAAAVAVIAAVAAGPLVFFPTGNPSIDHGQYVETDHEAIVRVLTRAEYEQLNMRVLRFAGTISTVMLVTVATLLSGAIETEKQRRDRQPQSHI